MENNVERINALLEKNIDYIYEYVYAPIQFHNIVLFTKGIAGNGQTCAY
jgi:hypothetical protein